MATCKCSKCQHVFTTRVIEDDPTTNSMVLAADEEGCPECGSTDFLVQDMDYTDPFMD